MNGAPIALKTSTWTAGYEAVIASRRERNKIRKSRRKSPQLLPALVAVGGACSLAAVPVNALELGNVQVNSTLGQPLRASIAFALNQNEQIQAHCIYLRPSAAGGIPAMSDAGISVTGSSIQITGKAPIREPLINLQVVVDCPYTPHLLREYTLLIDPIKPMVVPRSFVTNAPVAEFTPGKQAVAPVASQDRRVSAATRGRIAQSGDGQSPVAMNSRYRVQPDDSISTIVSRIENRSMRLWPAINIVFAANPGAFVNQDVNRLMAGYELIIPDLTGKAASDTTSAATSPTSTRFETSVIPEPIVAVSVVTDTQKVTDVTSSPTAEDVQEISMATDAPVVERAPAAIDQVSVLRPGDVVMSPIASSVTAVDFPETAIDNQPAVVATVNSSVSSNTGTSGAWNWLIWLAGTGVALIVGLLFFGRRLRDRFGTVAAVTTAAAEKPRNIVADVDFEFEDTINAEAISLDADLGAGTGLDSGVAMDVAQDFSFSASGQDHSELDLEFTEEAAREPEISPTDIIPPRHREDSSLVLDEEEPATDDDDEYDLSMIVDATKQPLDQFDATAKNLHAVRIGDIDAGADDGGYTMTSAVDYHALAQDYQDEFTATMALDAEIEKAAKQLVDRMEEKESMDVTAEMPARPRQEFTAELATNPPDTIEAENDPEADGGQSDPTVEMSAAGSDITVDVKKI